MAHGNLPIGGHGNLLLEIFAFYNNACLSPVGKKQSRAIAIVNFNTKLDPTVACMYVMSKNDLDALGTI
jgi:hypothetical protein